ncbi:methyltransferase domain-containing protein [Aeromicrobium sp.]|uniref:methyltransferase domain-containing protein n=1 Tax=Aeromicrobium sp. TaxID=1871063 RepID=UPI003D6AFDBE
MLPTPDTHPGVAQSMAFGHLTIAFDDRVLKPRPWTQAQSRWAAKLLLSESDGVRALELCSGAGHIGLLALASARSTAHTLVVVDINPAACDFARRNAATAGMGDRVDVREGRIDDVIAPDERFELVIADPPWVPRAETGRLPDDPLIAIDGGGDGLDVVWSCLKVCETHLVPGGSVVLQLGSVRQADRVRERLRSTRSALTMDEVRTYDGGVLVKLMSSTKGGA